MVVRALLALTGPVVLAAVAGLVWAQRPGPKAPVLPKIPAAMELTRDVSGTGLTEVAKTVRAWSDGNGLAELAPPTLSTLVTFFEPPPTTAWKPEIHRGMPLTTQPTTTSIATVTAQQSSSRAATTSRLSSARSASSVSVAQTSAPRPTSTVATTASTRKSTTTSAETTAATPTTVATTIVTTTTSLPTTVTTTTSIATSTSASSREFVTGSDRGGASYYAYKAGTCAHRTLPFGTIVRVTNVATGASTTCRVADRGPFIAGRVIDLDETVFVKLAPISAGVFQAEIAW